MKRFLHVLAMLALAVAVLAGCGKKKLVNVAAIRLQQDDPEASMKLALKGMSELQLEMTPGNRYLLTDYRDRATNNFKGYIVLGDALDLQKDPHGAALAYWAAANYMRRVPYPPVEKGRNMKFAYEKLNALYQKYKLTDARKLADANMALANVYVNSDIVRNLQARYNVDWDREQRLIAEKKAAQIKVAAATAQVTISLFDKSANAAYNRQRAQRALQQALGELQRATAALNAAKMPAFPENSLSLMSQGNFPATISMQFFSNFGPNQAANADAVANVLRRGGASSNAATNAAANAAASGNTNAMIADFARLEQQTYMQEAGAK